MTRRCAAPRCSQTINSPCGGRAVRSTSMLRDKSAGSSRMTMKTRSNAAQTASAAARGERRLVCAHGWPRSTTTASASRPRIAGAIERKQSANLKSIRAS